MVPRALTIATSDSGGGAGIQADLKAFAAAGCHGSSVIVALTAQNTVAVTAVHDAPPEIVTAQLEAVFDDVGVDAAKTGMLFSRQLIETVADFLDAHPVPLVVDPVLVASSGATLLRADAVETLVRRLFPLAVVVTPNLPEAQALTGLAVEDRRVLAELLVELGAPAALVTGGHGEPPVDHLFDGREHVEIPVERHRRGLDPRRRLHALRHAHRPPRARGEPRRRRPRARRLPLPFAVEHGHPDIGAGDGPVDVLSSKRSQMNASPGAALRELRERRPLVHQITNYVVMNETANATLALGALPVMAHAPQEVEEMAAMAGALVLNIGTLSESWVDAMLAAGRAANEAGVPVVLDPVGAGATRYRTETARLLLDEVDVAVLRGNAAEVAALAGRGGGDPRRRVDRDRRRARRPCAGGGEAPRVRRGDDR